jgi:hypothetical protein
MQQRASQKQKTPGAPETPRENKMTVHDRKNNIH